MGFLSNLVNRKAEEPQRPAAPSKRPSSAGGPRQEKSAVPVPLRQPVPRSLPTPPLYKSVSDLPPHKSVVSLPGGRFELSPGMRQHMFVLELEGEANCFAVVATKDHYGSAIYHGTVDRLQKAGASIRNSGIGDGALVIRFNKETRSSQADGDSDKPILRDIEKLAQAALDADASDIHIESRGHSATVRLRINGRLQQYSDSWTHDYVTTMARALHTIADDDSKPTAFTNDCQMSVSMNLMSGARLKLRVQMSPAYPDDGTDIVIRLLRVAAAAKVKTLEALGYAPDHIEMMEYMQSSPHGLIVIAGTTGSGKSTTLQTVMQNLRRADPGRKLISIEDPPEYVLDGVTQIPVARRKDNGSQLQTNPFLAAMRNTMRMDPDVIMIGEIRDSESAKLMVAMVQSGHMALTTIHTESAIGIISRLRGMGVDADIMSGRGFISGLIFQTLVPTLCRYCRLEYTPDMPEIAPALHERIRHVVKEGDTLFVESAHGCNHCGKSGISGRTVCAEMVVPDSAMRDAILANDLKAVHTQWRHQRHGKAPTSMMGATALDHALLKMRRGEVSPAAVEGALGLLHDFGRDTDLVGQVSALMGLED